MTKKIEYRESDYFNENDDFLFKDNYGKWLVSGVHFYNGAWYTNKGLKSQQQLADIFKIKKEGIWKIVNNYNWKHI